VEAAGISRRLPLALGFRATRLRLPHGPSWGRLAPEGAGRRPTRHPKQALSLKNGARSSNCVRSTCKSCAIGWRRGDSGGFSLSAPRVRPEADGQPRPGVTGLGIHCRERYRASAAGFRRAVKGPLLDWRTFGVYPLRGAGEPGGPHRPSVFLEGGARPSAVGWKRSTVGQNRPIPRQRGRR